MGLAARHGLTDIICKNSLDIQILNLGNIQMYFWPVVATTLVVVFDALAHLVLCVVEAACPKGEM